MRNSLIKGIKMKRTVETTLKEFPSLSWCVVLDRARRSVASGRPGPEADLWVDWFCTRPEALEFLRIRRRHGGELIFKHLGSNFFLVVLNERENMAQLLNYLTQIRPIATPDQEKEATRPVSFGAGDLKIQDAVRIQRLIIPQSEIIREDFKKFFVVHQQQDVVGGDFYWHKKVGNQILVALVDCTGHSIEGAMTSMICNSLLNQASAMGMQDLALFVNHFYELLSEYNHNSDQSDYGIGAEIGVFCFDYDSGLIRFASTGISAFLRKKDEMELIRSKKLIDYSMVREMVKEQTFEMQDVQGLYIFTDGLTDQFDAKDEHKLGLKGVRRMIEAEGDFASDYYFDQINRWKGDNMQYDDITLLGMAI